MRVFFRLSLIILFYAFFTSFVGVTARVSSDFMNPTLVQGDALLIAPVALTEQIFHNSTRGRLDRGDVVLCSANYSEPHSFFDVVLDPLVRLVTFQKKSLLYKDGQAVVLRIVALPGDTIKFKDYTAFIKPEGEDYFYNESELTSDYYDIYREKLPGRWKKDYPFSSWQKEIQLAEDEYFLAGDNRIIHGDSRIWGPVKLDRIKGKVVMKYWPVMNIALF